MTQVRYRLPDWYKPSNIMLPRLEDQVKFAIDLSKSNVRHGTGGPFGAAVFNKDGRIVGVGTNRVVPENCSMLHAEVMAIMVAQFNINNWNLGGGYRLVTSCQPCCMCFGAILWSGVSEMVYAATAEDARAIGFDEGPLVANWEEEYRERGIEVVGPVMREEAKAVLQLYAKTGEIYNPDR